MLAIVFQQKTHVIPEFRKGIQEGEILDAVTLTAYQATPDINF